MNWSVNKCNIFYAGYWFLPLLWTCSNCSSKLQTWWLCIYCVNGCCVSDDVQYNATERVFVGLFRTIQSVFHTWYLRVFFSLIRIIFIFDIYIYIYFTTYFCLSTQLQWINYSHWSVTKRYQYCFMLQQAIAQTVVKYYNHSLSLYTLITRVCTTPLQTMLL